MPSGTGTSGSPAGPPRPSRYVSQKRRDWATFTRYLCAHRPPLELRQCSGAHVLEFLRYLDRFGKTKVHEQTCPAYGKAGTEPPASCQCPLRQAWGSLDALVGRLRAAYDERHGSGSGIIGGDNNSSNNPFAARAVRLYLRDVRDAQSVARGISYNNRKKKRKKQTNKQGSGTGSSSSSRVGASTSSKDDTVETSPSVAPELHAPYPPPRPFLNGVSFECGDFSSSLLLGGGGGYSACPSAGCCNDTFYLPWLFNSFG